MDIDIYAKSQKLLENLANAIHDREANKLINFCFNATEMRIVESCLHDIIQEYSNHDILL